MLVLLCNVASKNKAIQYNSIFTKPLNHSLENIVKSNLVKSNWS